MTTANSFKKQPVGVTLCFSLHIKGVVLYQTSGFWWTTSFYSAVKYSVFPFRIILALSTEYLQWSFEFHCKAICFFKSSITINEVYSFALSIHNVPKGFPDGNNGADKKAHGFGGFVNNLPRSFLKKDAEILYISCRCYDGNKSDFIMEEQVSRGHVV